MIRVALVGAGGVSRIHAEAVAAIAGLRVAVVIDPDLGAAERLARVIRAGAVGAQALPALEAGLAADLFDRAHVLVPPDLHAGVGEALLRAGKPVLMEKPLGASAEDCARLLAAAGSTPLGVNQNFLHHPAFVKLHACLADGRIGPVRAVSCLYSVPLRQLAARQFGAWMFRRPGNLLLEQAVHPLSQIVALAGFPHALHVAPEPGVALRPGLPFVAGFSALLDGPAPAQLRFSVGEGFPCWRLVVTGSDGVATADMLNGRFALQARTRWMGPVDQAVSGLAEAGGMARQALGNFAGYAGQVSGRRGRADGYFRAMRGSIAAFHAAVEAGDAPAADGVFGARLVGLCEQIAAAMPEPRPRPPRPPPSAPAPSEIAVLGGTGFIGTHLVRQLVAAERRVVVMARNPRNLPEVFDDSLVRVERGDITDEGAVAQAIAGCRVVVNLAHGGASGGFEDIRHAMVGGAETVARACRDSLARRLVHVGSIAALYLGPQRGVVTGATPVDPRAAERADYARAKALAEALLLELHRREGLPVVILRPGIVVGDGGSPFHGGVGLYNNPQHYIGWNAGRNPLPFVLAEDVAAAILRACDAEGVEGRCYNLVGDIRPSAREYTAMLAAELNRPLRFHSGSASGHYLADLAKWAVKRAAGRAERVPSRRDFLSRGMTARFDCSDAVRDLMWHPNANPEHFRAQAISSQILPPYE